MADFFDKLGDLLNEVLQEGHIPQPETQESVPESTTDSVQAPETSEVKQNAKKTLDSSSNKKINLNISDLENKNSKKKPSGQIIKNYTFSQSKDLAKNIILSEETKRALKIMELSYPFTLNELKKKYHQLLFKYHPDSVQTNIENPKILLNLRQKQTEQITDAYKHLEQFIQNLKV